MTNTERSKSRETTHRNPALCISLYLPACTEVREAQHHRVRITQLLTQLEHQLEARQCPPEVIRDLIAPFHELRGQLDRLQQVTGLALFRRAGFFRYHAAPFPVPELCVVGDHFHLSPLIDVSDEDRPFYLLALNQGGAKLFEAVSGTLIELQDVVFPPSPVASGDPMDGQRNRHAERSVRGGFPLLHRHQSREYRKPALQNWFRRIDDVLRTRFGQTNPPIVLVAVQYLCPMFRHVSRYPNLLDGEIHGSPDRIPAEDLRRRGWNIASAHFQAERQKTADEYLRLWHTPRASNDIRDIETAARAGRVQTLFVGIARSQAELGNGSSRTASRGQSQDVLEQIALNTFVTGGTVHAVPPDQIPGRQFAAAVFRY